MTIKPKKKLGKDKPDPENSDVHTSVHSHSHAVHPHSHTHGLSHNHPHVHSHYHHTGGNETRHDKQQRVRSSPTRWLPSTSAHAHDEYAHTHTHGHSNLASTLSASANFESLDVSSNHKRRHRSSPHRTVRKHHRNHTPNVNNVTSVGVAANNSGLVTLGDNEADCDDEYSGYNSEDEHSQPPIVPENIGELEKWFEEALAEKKGFRIKKMGEDGACLFRAVADQVYGDQEMHGIVRKHCLDYMSKNAEFYSQYVTEDFQTYLNRKRMESCHGNHLEIQAMTEMFNRPVEVYQYGLDPMNTFDTACKSDIPPIRLSYHGNVHYNSIVDPYAASIGVGLGLPGFQPGLAERNLMKDAINHSENIHIEQTMLEDKIRETDWEVTQDSIDEQVARESYLQWLREQEKASRRTKGGNSRSSASATSSSSTSEGNAPGLLETGVVGGPMRSPRQLRSGNNSPQQQSQPPAVVKEDPFVPLPGSSKSPCHSPKHPSGATTSRNTTTATDNTSNTASGMSSGLAGAASMHLPPTLYGLTDWGEEDILAQVMAQSQQEYLDNLRKKATSSNSSGSAPSSPGQSPQQSFSTSSHADHAASGSGENRNANNVAGFSGTASTSFSSQSCFRNNDGCGGSGSGSAAS